MNKIFISLLLIISSVSLRATSNTWTGSGSSNSWSDAGNWSNGTPLIDDTVFFDAATITVNIDIAPNIAGLQLINASNVIFSSSLNTLITIGNLNVSGFLVFNIEAGSSLTLQGEEISTGVSIQTYGNFTTTRAVVAGTFVLGINSCTWTINSFPFSFCTTDISGIVRVASGNTGSVLSGGLSNGNAGTVSFMNGSLLEWLRNGGSAPNARFMDGSVISVKGITGSNLVFNSSAVYNGLLLWNCSQQTISGGNALLLPAAYTSMDSVRIISTGSGSLRFATNPNGYTINSLEVNSGIVELSAPNSSATSSLADTINEFKISGGTVYGNATYSFDNLGAAYPNTLFVKRIFTMTGGTFDFTNRTGGNAPGGSFSMYVSGDLSQIGGRLKATQAFSSQNLIELNGTVAQHLTLSSISDSISLAVNNSEGVILLGDLTLPYFLNLKKGHLELFDLADLTIAASRITQAPVTPVPSIITNGGKLIITDIPQGSQIFPIAPFTQGYNPVTVTNNSTLSRTISMEVANQIYPDSDIDTLKVINRRWDISAAPPLNDGSVSLTFQYADSERVSGSMLNPAAAMRLGRYTDSWSYDPASQLIPSGGPVSYTAGPYSPQSLNGSYILGNTGFIKSIYIFTGNGNWNISSNWLNNAVPPNPLPAGKQILIDPGGSCTLNISQTVSAGSKIVVGQNKNFILPGSLMLQ